MAADVDGSWARYCADRKRGAKARFIPAIGCVSLTDEEFALVLEAAEALRRPAGDPAPAAPTISAAGGLVAAVANRGPAFEPANLSDWPAAEADRYRNLGHAPARRVVETIESIAIEAGLVDAATAATPLDRRGAIEAHGSADTA